MALYEPTPGATHRGIAADLDIAPGTLRASVLAEHERRGADTTAAPVAQSPLRAQVPRGTLVCGPGAGAGALIAADPPDRDAATPRPVATPRPAEWSL